MDVLLLHGALGSDRQWQNIADELEKHYPVHNLCFPGHGYSPEQPEHLDLQSLGEFVRSYIADQNLRSYALVGYSMGAYVGLRLAIDSLPGLEKLITVATKTLWSPEIAEEEIARLTPENLLPIEEKLRQEHAQNYPGLLSLPHGILRSIGERPLEAAELATLQIPLYMMVGEKDRMVSVEETVGFASAAPMGASVLLPGQPHLLERMDGALLSAYLLRYLA